MTNSLGGGSQSVQYSDALSPDVTVSATDADSLGSALTAAASRPPGRPLARGRLDLGRRRRCPGRARGRSPARSRAPPGVYPVTVTVTDDTGGTGTTSFTIVVHVTGIIGLDNVSVGAKNAVVDSFDSALGPTAPATKASAALLLGNAGIMLGGAQVTETSARRSGRSRSSRTAS